MRILHVTKRYPAAHGGDAAIVSCLEDLQRRAGHDVFVLTSNCIEITGGPHVRKAGLHMEHSALDQLTGRRLVSLLLVFLSSFRYLRRLRPDLVHAHAVDLGVAMSLAAHLLHIPQVITLHGTDIGNLDCAAPRRWLERMLVRVAGYDVVLSVSPQALRTLSGLARMAPRYVPNSVVAGMPSTMPPTGDQRGPLLFIGRLETVKGIDYLLQSLLDVRQRVPDVRLRLVGSGSLDSTLRQRVLELGLDDHVEFAGVRDRHGVAVELSAASAVVIASVREGFPLVLLEAWAAGVPVVTTAVGAIPAVCRDGHDAVVVPPRDPGALAAGLVQALTDRGLRARLSASGRELVRCKYDPAVVAGLVEDVYWDVLALRGTATGRRDQFKAWSGRVTGPAIRR